MKVDEIAQRGFALHQTFPPRFGWLKKSFDLASADGKVFSDDEATVKLGVGKNMVDAIAFWSQAFHILDVQKSPKKKESSLYVPTAFGTLMFDETYGLDPYLEIPHSLWLLHWMSLQPTSRLPAWWLTFSEFERTEFSSKELEDFIHETVLVTSWKYDNKKAIERDVDCLLRMYSPRLKKSRLTIDDYLDSPFRDLGIIRPSSLETGGYRFQLGDKPNLDAKLVVLTCIHFMMQLNTFSATVPHLLNDSGAPGKIFRLSESSLASYLHEGIQNIEGVKIATPAGVTQLVIENEYSEIVVQLLGALYFSDTPPNHLKSLVIETFANQDKKDAEDSAVEEVRDDGGSKRPPSKRVKKSDEAPSQAVKSRKKAKPRAKPEKKSR